MENCFWHFLFKIWGSCLWYTELGAPEKIYWGVQALMGGILYWLIPPQCTRILGSTAGPAVRGVVKQILKRVKGLDMSFISASQKHNVLHWSPIHLTLIIFVRIILNNYCTQSPWTYFGGRAELKKVLRCSGSKSWWSFRSWVFYTNSVYSTNCRVTWTKCFWSMGITILC